MASPEMKEIVLEETDGISFLGTPRPYFKRLKFRQYNPLVRMVYWIWLILGVFLYFGSLLASRYTTSTHVVSIDETNSSWAMLADEGLQLVAYFSEGLGGSSKSNIPQEWPIKKSNYHFGPVGMCRINTLNSDSICYYGVGLDMPSMIVRDLGTQIGTIGEVENPVEFGLSTEKLYHSAIREVEDYVSSDRFCHSNSTDQNAKLKAILYLSEMRAVANTCLGIWVVMGLTFTILFLSEFAHFLSLYSAVRFVLKVNYILQIIYLIEAGAFYLTQLLGSILARGFLKSYGLHWSIGLTLHLLLVHWIISVILTILSCYSLKNEGG